MKSYSQLGQDLFAARYFTKYPPKNKVFVDVGAFDGFHYSNTYLFYEQGWEGVCVEACSKNYKKLENLYRDSKISTIHTACADYEGQTELHVATIPGSEDWGSDVSSLSENVLEEWRKYIWGKEIVQVTTLTTILEQESIEDFSYLSIDVEGLELSVLKGLDFNKYKPDLIITEYHNKKEKLDIVHFLNKNGYMLVDDNKQDIFFIRFSIKKIYFYINHKGNTISNRIRIKFKKEFQIRS